MALYLGIETSCDESAAAVVENGRKVHSNQLFSQITIHREYGGVVPEVAARKHLESINFIIEKTLQDAGLTPKQLDGIACTTGPGLVGALLVGLSAAKALSWAWEVPLIAVDHLQAHVCANYIDSDLKPPFIALLVSGGHTQIIYVKDYQNLRLLGETLDDAAGEAYDKVGRLLGLPYPGGPAIDKLAAYGNANAFKFPVGVVSDYNFSFSGLKTAVMRTVQKLEPPLPVADLAAAFQDSVVKVLVRKTIKAQHDTQAPCIVLAGGVAANSELRQRLVAESSVPVHFPKPEFCTDNAAMVASAAFFCGQPVGFDCEAYSRR